MIRQTMESFEKIQAKHPTLAPGFYNEDDYNEIMSFVPDPADKHKITVESLQTIVKKAANQISPGLDKTRYEHLKVLIGNSVVPDASQTRFTVAYAKVLEIIANVEYPVAVSPWLRDTEALGLAKPPPDDGVRPIGKNSLPRKLVSISMFHQTKAFNAEHFAPFAFGLESNGCESIVHSLRFCMEAHPDWHVYTVDADNAFNRASRVKGLKEVKTYFPQFLPFLREMYLTESTAWFHGLPDSIHKIRSQLGYHQGDVLASWLYQLGNMPFIKRIDDLISQAHQGQEGNNRTQKWYVDDGTFAAPPAIMNTIIETIVAEGGPYGYSVNFNKGGYLLSRYDTLEQAVEVQVQLNERYQIPLDRIQVHPYNNAEDANLKLKYGIEVLGCYIGSDEYIRLKLNELLLDYSSKADNLINQVENIQERWIIFNRSFCCKPNYILRTTPPALSHDFAIGFEVLKKKVLCSIVGIPPQELSDLDYKLCNFSLKEGGLGMQNFIDVASAAFVASMVDYHNNHNQCLAGMTGEYYQHMVTTIQQHFVGEGRTLESILQLTRTVGETVQNKLAKLIHDRNLVTVKSELRNYSAHHFKWHLHLCNATAGKWLEVIPAFSNQQMSNPVFRTALCFRMFLRTPGHLTGARCSCARHPYLDDKGHHLATGCGKHGHRNNTHDSLKYEMKSILSYCGLHTVLEERNLFAHSDIRPDISVNNPPRTVHPKLLLDITVSSTLTRDINGHLHVIPPVELQEERVGKAAQAAYNRKLAAYGQVCELAGFSFKPLVFESSGFMHHDVVAFLKDLAHDCSEVKQIPAETLFQHFLKRLSYCLQHCVANNIVKRLHNLRGQVDHGQGQEWQEQYILNG